VQGRGVRLEYLPWPFSLLSTSRREITLESCMSHFPGTWTPHAFFYIFAIKLYWGVIIPTLIVAGWLKKISSL
jgi:hypothetical protein